MGVVQDDKEIEKLMDVNKKQIVVFSRASKLIITNYCFLQDVKDLSHKGEPEYMYLNKELKKELDDLLDLLNRTDRKLIKTIFGYHEEKRKMSEIGRMCGISRQAVRDSKERILRTLRKKQKQTKLVA